MLPLLLQVTVMRMLMKDIIVHVFVQPRVPSFLSLDVDGRVLRLDSFSKTIGGG